MKKLLTTTILAGMMTFSAHATKLDSFFFANGYTKPSITLVEIQDKIDSGVYTQYPYVAGKSETGLFEDKLKPGTALPQIRNITSLLAAVDKKQIVKVASTDSSINYYYSMPVFVELAKQNGITGKELVDFLVEHELVVEGEDGGFFSNIDNLLSTIEDKIAEIQAELNEDVQDEISKEVSKEVTNEVTEEIAEEISEEINNEIQEEIQEEIVEEILDSIDIQDIVEAIEEAGITELSYSLDRAAGEVKDRAGLQEIADTLSEFGDYGDVVTALDVASSIQEAGRKGRSAVGHAVIGNR